MYITSACLLDLVFVTIMTNQYWVCTRGDHESSCIRNWCAKKEQIACKVNLEDSKFDGYCSFSVFCDWLTDIECYLDWHGLSDVISPIC